MTKTPKQIAKAAKASSPIPEAQERNMWSMIVNQGEDVSKEMEKVSEKVLGRVSWSGSDKRMERSAESLE